MKNNIARHHHWIPRFYLKRFTNTSLREGKLFVVDFSRGKYFLSSPNGVGAKRDFNRVDIPGHPPDVIETALSPFEDEIDRAIGRTIKSKKFLDNADASLILNLVALIAVRNPRFRESRRDLAQRTSEIVMELTLASKERYESAMLAAQKDGVLNRDTIVPYEDMLSFHKQKKYKYEIAREFQIAQEFKVLDSVLEALAIRSWTFIVAGSNAGTFVTSDHPVLLRPNRQTDAPIRLGFGLRAVDVIFPVSKRLCIVGSFDDDRIDKIADQELVALINTQVAMDADQQIYCSNDSVKFYSHREGALMNVSDILKEAALE